MSAIKVTYKRQPAERGLAAVGNPNQSIDCKIKGKRFGTIDAPNWQTKDNLWRICLMIMKTERDTDSNTNCDWKNITLQVTFEEPEQAKEWMQKNINAIMERYTLRYSED